ncbi:MAG: hypothetical protein Q4G22_09940 [Paracoccus sp. (in: a-proteobacteria)]|uniref:hypothetical protein n=1 Tax=Paracoccus sp. TaxID=267 RepID=UPI0026DF2F82|nr:hypothetical protein [Paracoccus sp. (in: a-proteobacteria)]MDO5632146.1 hypothetical protein [Paracoccus sp. (in: a-proteobacteria)]
MSKKYHLSVANEDASAHLFWSTENDGFETIGLSMNEEGMFGNTLGSRTGKVSKGRIRPVTMDIHAWRPTAFDKASRKISFGPNTVAGYEFLSTDGRMAARWM